MHVSRLHPRAGFVFDHPLRVLVASPRPPLDSLTQDHASHRCVALVGEVVAEPAGCPITAPLGRRYVTGLVNTTPLLPRSSVPVSSLTAVPDNGLNTGSFEDIIQAWDGRV